MPIRSIVTKWLNSIRQTADFAPHKQGVPGILCAGCSIHRHKLDFFLKPDLSKTLETVAIMFFSDSGSQLNHNQINHPVIPAASTRWQRWWHENLRNPLRTIWARSSCKKFTRFLAALIFVFYPSLCCFVYLSIRLCIYPSIHTFFYLPIHLFPLFYLHIYLFICLCLCLSENSVSIHQSIWILRSTSLHIQAANTLAHTPADFYLPSFFWCMLQ